MVNAHIAGAPLAVSMITAYLANDWDAVRLTLSAQPVKWDDLVGSFAAITTAVITDAALRQGNTPQEYWRQIAPIITEAGNLDGRN